MTAELRVGQVAAAAGVNIETLRYYERRGLLAQPDRSLGGHRLYPAETVTRLRVIKTAQRLLDLVVIRDTLRQALDAGCDDLLACADTHCCPLPFARTASELG